MQSYGQDFSLLAKLGTTQRQHLCFVFLSIFSALLTDETPGLSCAFGFYSNAVFDVSHPGTFWKRLHDDQDTKNGDADEEERPIKPVLKDINRLPAKKQCMNYLFFFFFFFFLLLYTCLLKQLHKFLIKNRGQNLSDHLLLSLTFK